MLLNDWQRMEDGLMDIQLKLQLPLKQTNPGDRTPATLSLRPGDRIVATVLDVNRGTDALLAFGQFKAYARLPVPVAVGQAVELNVESPNERLRLVMSTTREHGAAVSAGEKMPVRLFEPVSDASVLNAHAKSLTPGTTLYGRITGFEKDGLQLVDFGRFKAFTKIDIPVRQDQRVPLAVLKNDNGLTMTVAEGKPASQPANLSPLPVSGLAVEGQPSALQQATPTAAAVRSKPVQSQMNVSSTSAGNSDPLPPTSAEIVALREQVRRLLEGLSRPSNAADVALSSPTAKAMVNLQQALEPASVTGDTATLVGRIRDFVENSGIYFEKRVEQVLQRIQDSPQALAASELSRHPALRELMVKDLKPNLMILKQFLDSFATDLKTADRHVIEAMKTVVERTLAHIDHQQVAATEKPVDPVLYQAFSHLMLLPDHPRNARLNVYYAKKGRDDGSKNPRVSLLLEMDRMGSVRTDLWMVDKNLNVTFFVSEPEIKTIIDAEQHRIGEMLQPMFDTVAVNVVVNVKKIAEFDGEDLTMPEHRQFSVTI